MRCIIQTYGNDGYINIEADYAVDDPDFVTFYKENEIIVAMVAKTELKSFYFSEKKR